MPEQRADRPAKAVFFIALATLMYYFLTQILELRVYISYRHLFALAIVFCTFVYFLVRPDLPRAAAAVKSGLALSVPLLVMTTASLPVWFLERTDFEMISRGLSYNIIAFNQATAMFAAVSFLFLFGERGVWYNLIAVLCANLLMIATIMVENGVGPYLNELWTLIRTFAGETGQIIVEAEIHELAFCLGVYLVYMFLWPKRQPWFFALLGAAGFCFLSAFKRIAMAAIAAALAMGWLLRLLEKRWPPKRLIRFIQVITLIGLLLLFLYVAAVKLGAFSFLEEIGIDTKGRADAYEQVSPFYQISPAFLGNGMGFLTYQINETENLHLPMAAIHNDFLLMYIDLGFWGYLLWLLSFATLRIWYFARQGKAAEAVNTFTLVAYMLLVSTTDNTMSYPLVHTCLGILIAGHGFDGRVEEERRRLARRVALANGTALETDPW